MGYNIRVSGRVDAVQYRLKDCPPPPPPPPSPRQPHLSPSLRWWRASSPQLRAYSFLAVWAALLSAIVSNHSYIQHSLTWQHAASDY